MGPGPPGGATLVFIETPTIPKNAAPGLSSLNDMGVRQT